MPKVGYKQTLEHRNKIRKTKFGNKACLGKHWTEATKEKIRKSLLGKKLSEERKIHMRKPKKEISGRDISNYIGGYENQLWHNRRRRVQKLGNGGFHIQGDWETLKAQYNWICPACKRQEPEIKLTEDHIVPLSKGGSDNIENIQPLCKSCNCKKHTKIIKYEF